MEKCKCKRCNGYGVVLREFYNSMRECPVCRGKGWVRP